MVKICSGMKQMFDYDDRQLAPRSEHRQPF